MLIEAVSELHKVLMVLIQGRTYTVSKSSKNFKLSSNKYYSKFSVFSKKKIGLLQKK